jgi:hypothetical protein
MSEYNRYDSGQLVRIRAVTRDFNDNVGDPTALEIRYKNPVTEDIVSELWPSGSAIQQDSTGEFHLDIDTTDFDAGAWHYKTIATGAIVSALEWAFIINEDGTD